MAMYKAHIYLRTCRTIGTLEAVQKDADRYHRRCLGLQSSARRLSHSLGSDQGSPMRLFLKDTLFKLKEELKR